MPRADEQNRDYVIALARGLAVLGAFTTEKEQITLAEVAKLVDLSRATVRRSLLTLETLGFIESDGKHFQIAPKVLTLAQAYLSSSLLPRVSRPFLERMSDRLNESCSVSVLDGLDIIYVARSSRRRQMSALLRDVGTHLPAYCTSMGRILLGALPARELDAYFARVELVPRTRFTVVNEAKLRKIIAKARQDEYCISDQQFEIDLRTIAVPLQNASGRVIAALTATTRASETPKERLIEKFLPILRATTAEMRPLLVG